MNNDSNNDLARYHGFPPVLSCEDYEEMTGTERKKWQDSMIELLDGIDEAFAPHKPTPTIPQMEDRHEQAILREKLAVWLTRATVSFSIVAMSLFIASLIYRATVGVY